MRIGKRKSKQIIKINSLEDLKKVVETKIIWYEELEKFFRVDCSKTLNELKEHLSYIINKMKKEGIYCNENEV